MTSRVVTALSRVDRLRLAAEALVDERSISAVYSGRTVRSMTRERIVQAARRLSLPLPPEQPSTSEE
jgi:hypothetical protein